MLEENSTAVIIFITCKDTGEARKIAAALVEQHLIACGNITTEVQSIFHWQGKVEDESEVLLIAKSRREHMSEIIRRVSSLHSYETPEIIALPIVAGSKDYLDWISKETTTNPAE